METKIINGYRYVYKPGYYPNGDYVAEHILVAEAFLKRRLEGNEVVHHLNLDKLDNRRSNLIVLTNSMHVKLHRWIGAGCPLNGPNDFSSEKFPYIETYKSCKQCGITLQPSQNVFCSIKCRGIDQTTISKPTKEVLESLVGKISWKEIGRKFGVSDNGARKWARSYGLIGGP